MKNSNIFRTVLSVITVLLLISVSAFGQGNVTNSGNVTNTGTIKAKDYTNTGAAAAFTNSGAGSELWIRGVLTTNAGGTPADPQNFDVKAGLVRYYKSGDQDVNAAVKDATYNNLYLTGSGAKTISAAMTLTGTATADAASFANSTFKLTVQGATPFAAPVSGGSYTLNTGEVDYNGAAQSVYGTTYATLTMSGTLKKTMSGDVTASTALALGADSLSIGGNTLTIAGTVSGSAPLSGSNASNLIVNGAGLLTLPVIKGNELGNFTYNRGTDSVLMSNDINVRGTLATTAGVLQVGVNTLNIYNTVTAGTGGFASYISGTVNYAKATDNQDVLAAQYGNLSFSNAAKTLPAGIVSIAGTFTAGTSATAHTVTGNTITFNNAADGQSIPTFNVLGGGVGYNNLTTANGDKTVGGNLTVAGDFTNGAAVVTNVSTYTLAITGTKSQADNAAKMQFAGLNNGVVFASGIVEYNGAIAQTVTAGTYRDLEFTNGTLTTAEKTIAGAVTATNNLTVNASGFLTVSGTLQVDNDISNAGSMTNSGTITVGL